MCLDELFDLNLRTNIGYKVLYKLPKVEGYSPPFKNTHIVLKKDEWVEDPEKSKIYNKYKTGFHIFTEFGGAIYYLKYGKFERCNKSRRCHAIYKVEFSDITATGIQFDYGCVVARKIKVLEECV